MLTALFGTLGKGFPDSLKGGTQLNEQEMYPIIEAFLKKKGYKTLVKHRFYKREIRADVGQGYIELDAIGYKDDVAWHAYVSG